MSRKQTSHLVPDAHPLNDRLRVAVAEYEDRSDDQLMETLVELMSITTDSLVRMAAVLRLLEDRGFDLSEIRIGLKDYIRKIAHGQLLPEVVARLQGHDLLLSRVASLPLPDQRKVVEMIDDGTPAKVMCWDDQGTTHRLVPVLRLGKSEVHQVFAPDHIRDEGEQLSWASKRRWQSRPIGQSNAGPIVLDKKRRCIVVTGESVRLTLKDLNEWAAKLSD